ncbi:tyrosine-type recombinase/integrase [Escherichia coli]
MSRVAAPITDSKARLATADPGKRIKVYGGNGLILVVTGRMVNNRRVNAKQWFYRYKYAGKTKEISMGKYPLVSVAKAYERVRELAAMVEAGLDPLIEKERRQQQLVEQEAITLGLIIEQWKAAPRRRPWSANYQKYINQILNHIPGKLLQRPIASINTFDLLCVLDGIKGAQGQRVPTVEKAVAERLNEIFRFAMFTKRVIADNPAKALFTGRFTQPVQHKRHIPTDCKDQITSLATALRESENIGQIACYLLLLTGLRSAELRQARWSWVDWSTRELTVPGEYMKGRIAHTVYLPVQAMRTLARLRIASDGEYILMSKVSTSCKPIGVMAFNQALRQLGYHDEVTPHGFRSMLYSWCGENGISQQIADQLLAHVEPNKVRRAYSHAEHARQKREALQRWADYLDGMNNEVGFLHDAILRFAQSARHHSKP